MDTNRATTGIGHGWTRTTTTTDSNHGDAETRRRAAGTDEDDGMFGTKGGWGIVQWALFIIHLWGRGRGVVGWGSGGSLRLGWGSGGIGGLWGWVFLCEGFHGDEW